jgi:YVTN family beta-propeller protein
MKKTFAFVILLHFFIAAFSQVKSVTLPNGWKLSPAGRQVPTGDLPLNIMISSRGSYMAIINSGYSTQSIQLFSPRTSKQLDSIIIDKSWYGLAFSKDEKTLYASGGNDNNILEYEIKQNKLVKREPIPLGKPWPVKIAPAGIAIDDAKQILYVVTKDNNRLYLIDLKTKLVNGSFDIGGEGYTCVLSNDRKTLYVSCWGCDKVKLFDTEIKKWITDIPVGDNPNEMILNRNGNYLFVSNANDNSVSIIDTKKQAVIETLNAAMYPSSLPGSTTNGVALNAKENRLYIANADNNCLAVFDVTHPGNSHSLGFIPTGWYPTSVRCFGKNIFVANGKGLTSKPNVNGPNPLENRRMKVQMAESDKAVQHIGGLFTGTLSIIPEPSLAVLKNYSEQVYKNAPYTPEKEINAETKGTIIPKNNKQPSPIKYVFYVIKENRTYDQILGDVKQGNGDSSLVLFGNATTPNQHRLVNDFVLLDNFYVDAEVSADGHNWSMGAYATDFLEKTWPTRYGGRGGTYDAEGHRAIANNKGGFLWDHCAKAGVSYRTYGEFADNNKANIPVLKNHFCPYFTGFDLSVKDTTRFQQWKQDFDSLLAAGALPRLNTVRFGNDHTEGMRKGKPTPFAHIADNDLAVGMFIEYLSKSPIWNETAIFILEDDAQNGADHVDAHRSTAYLAGGFVKRNFVDHTPYTTTSMLRTMELILGIPPMTQYDAGAVPMWRCFDSVARPYNFTATIPEVNLDETNTAINQWQKISEKFNLAKEDSNPDLEFNEVLWHAVKGDRPFPGPKHAAFIKEAKEDGDDD